MMEIKDYSKIEKFKIIKSFIKEKKVLEVGCNWKGIINKKSALFDHDYIRKISSETKAIDLDEKGVNYLKERGYDDVEVGDAEKMGFEKEFDVVYAGDLIEHLGKPGIFIKNAYEALKDNGKLILETPNAFSFTNLVYAITKNDSDIPVNEEHTMLFTESTLKELLRRYGFNVLLVKYFHRHEMKKTINGKIRDFFHYILGPKSKTSLLFICEKK